MLAKYGVLIAGLLILFGCSSQLRKGSVETSPSKTPVEDAVRAENYVADGIELYKTGKYDGAIQKWNKALRIIPDDAEVHNFAGTAYHKLGMLDSAISAYKKAVLLEPDYFQAWNNLGFMYFLKGDYREALGYFNHALVVNPNYEQAIMNYQKTKEIVNGDLPARALELVEKSGKIDSLELKIQNYRKAIALDSAYVEAWNNLGVAYYYYGYPDSAVSCLEKALELNPKYPQANNNLGFLYDLKRNYEKATACYLKALEQKPDYVIALSNLFDTYMHEDNRVLAKQVLMKLKEIAPDNPVVRRQAEDYNNRHSEKTSEEGN